MGRQTTPTRQATAITRNCPGKRLTAATTRAEADAVAARDLAAVTGLAEHCLLAELPDALPTVMRILADRAALDRDVGHLAQALPALVRSLR